jgi:hypothetical protein
VLEANLALLIPVVFETKKNLLLKMKRTPEAAYIIHQLIDPNEERADFKSLGVELPWAAGLLVALLP